MELNRVLSRLESAKSDVLVLQDCGHAGTINAGHSNGTKELIAAGAGPLSALDESTHFFARALEIELRALSVLPNFSIGNLYHNIFSRLQSHMHEEPKEYSMPIYSTLAQDVPHSPSSIRLSAHKGARAITPGYLNIEESFEVRPSHFMGTDEISLAPFFLHSAAMRDGEMPRMAFAVRLNEHFKIGQPSTDLFL